MPPKNRSPCTNQRANTHQGHPWGQFCHLTALYCLVRPREDVSERAEQFVVLQILHVRVNHVETLRPTTSMSAVGTSTYAILTHSQMGHLLQNVDDYFEDNQRGDDGTMQKTFRSTFWPADIHYSRNAANSYPCCLCHLCCSFQCQSFRGGQNFPHVNDTKHQFCPPANDSSVRDTSHTQRSKAMPDSLNKIVLQDFSPSKTQW